MIGHRIGFFVYSSSRIASIRKYMFINHFLFDQGNYSVVDHRVLFSNGNESVCLEQLIQILV
jgi:hypothetical protein